MRNKTWRVRATVAGSLAVTAALLAGCGQPTPVTTTTTTTERTVTPVIPPPAPAMTTTTTTERKVQD